VRQIFRCLILTVIVSLGASVPSQGQTAPNDDADLALKLAQPDFTLVALPTTLRVPRHKGAFRVTHRFTRELGNGDFGDLASDLFGIDNGAQIGLEYRFGLFRGTQIGFHRTSDRTIEFFAQHEVKAQSDSFPLTISALGSIDGTNNFRDSYSPALGVILSRTIAEHVALYVEPIWVNNSNDLPSELVDDNNSMLLGLGTRLRVRPTVYIVIEGTPRIAGDKPNVSQIGFGLEKRAGGHTFQLNFSNGFGTTLGQIARGGTGRSDWYMGFNISRKFF
jgi:hypothetical protein